MIDTLLSHKRLAQASKILTQLGLKESGGPKRYGVVTLHRPSNVDDGKVLKRILTALNRLSLKMPVIFPMHPRTLNMIKAFNLEGLLHRFVEISPELQNEYEAGKVLAIPPLSYLDFLCLISNAALVLTDSGGIQEETTILKVPCLTLRPNTERPVTICQGTNRLVGNDPRKIYRSAVAVLKEGMGKAKNPKYWDGKAAPRIVKILTDAFDSL
jgi:UDP-N-acetylglucosamine 2-epimerase (non-hydrolysing)